MECCRGGLLRGVSTALPYAGGGGDEDRLSALPDDLLLRILAGLRCARAAAHTGLLARRWRGLWAGLPELTVASLLAAAAAVAPAELVVHASWAVQRIELPCFDRAASIKLDVYFVGFTLPLAGAGGFPALETLHLDNCYMDLSDMIPR
ncbi:hypothetical protein E2562_019347 [Oryza meyeriana var. granulata]|uniref:F-box domain-containing protein n=1 Tax=Oryza meyeriana var. granulata TaxID=110450 RepID=A0A6G1BLP7_9ORYZ|nr:hypothetical protein E2562_019347 [Oryza meyeriana var. granulata]